MDKKYYYNYLSWEAGLSSGMMNAFTDLGGKKGNGKGFIKDLNWNMSRPALGFYLMANYKEAVGMRAEATFGEVQGYDSVLKSSDPSLSGRYGRNLSFRSKITDLQLAFEVHPLFFKWYDEDQSPYWSPYIVAGIGFFRFNPQGKLGDTWHDLQPLRLEGQGFAEYPDRKPYKLGQLNIPIGAGVRYEISSLLHARLEVVHRLLFTDYLDDVSTSYIDPAYFSNYLLPGKTGLAQSLYSRMDELQPGYMPREGQQRGDPKDKDAFFTIQLKLGVRLANVRRK
ncbi:MAG TPA: DUF6089 family protein [Chitinophagaceae bacterium]|nr:DUF6089 family protein [Chitinophagaceae bacterium]